MARNCTLLAILFVFGLGQIEARRDPDEVDPAIFVKATKSTYDSLVTDPLLQKGQIKDFLLRSEFADLSKKDYKYIAKTLIDSDVAPEVNWIIQDTKLVIDDKKVFSKKVEIDFRDYTRKDSRMIYINGNPYELKLVPKVLTTNETRLVEQLKDIEKFLAADGIQAWLPYLDHNTAEKLLVSLQIITFPLTTLTACSDPSYDGKGMFGLVSTFYNNSTGHVQEFVERTAPPVRRGYQDQSDKKPKSY